MTPYNSAIMKSKVREIVEFVVITLVIVVPIRLFVAQPFIVSGTSMDNTFHDGQYLVVDELSYDFHGPSRGDVIVFKYPDTPQATVGQNDSGKYLIKRVIGLPGDTVIVQDNQVTIKNAANPNGFVLNQPFISSDLGDSREDVTVTLPADQYFVMGDNRAVSYDSRLWGPLPKSDITGRVIARLLPLNFFGIFPGKFNYAQ